MIKFFRKIRQRLLSESKFSKYLLYAIGEIVLVVIGILIALEINTRHQSNKAHQLEVKILKEISKDLLSDQQGLQDDIMLMDSLAYACTSAIDHLEKQELTSVQFGYHLNHLRITPHFDPNTSGYELLSSKGIELISNDSLRRQISELYETQYPYYRRYESERIAYVNLHIEPYLIENITFLKHNESYLRSTALVDQTTYDHMRNDASFMRRISGIDVENYYVHKRAKSTLSMVEALHKMIIDELEHEER